MPADRGQRRLQLVAHGEEERTLRVLRPAQLVGEVVEGRRKRRDLPRACDGNGARRLAARERTARRRDPGHRPGDAASEQERDRGRERGADEARRSEPERERSPVGLLARRRAKQHDRLAAALPGGEQEPRAADVDRAACRVLATEAPGGGVRQEQVGLRRREDREALLVGREEAAELVVHALSRILAALRGDEARPVARGRTPRSPRASVG